MKEAIGTTSLYTTVDCPNCDACIDIEPDEYGFEDGEQFGSENLNVEIECADCGNTFKLTGIEY